MTNKKVIRKENQTGKFTTTQHSILFDKRLKSNDKIILITILSDSDSFNITQQSLINRLDLKKVAIQTSMKNLEKFGYLKRKELKRGNYYIISEYGNLLVKDETDNDEEIPTINELPEPIIIETPIIEEIITELPIIELPVIEEKIELNDYEDEIVKLLGNAPIEKVIEILNYFETAITKGTLNNHNQMTTQNIKKVIEKFIPKETEVKCLNKTKLSEICDQNSAGNGMTQLNRKTVKNQIISHFSKNPTNSINDVETKILKLKMGYSRVGELDQRYQN
ncbi:hypothetical protein ACNQGL_07625 [Flavobacterium sp. LB3P21]|uniref:hypothetical protein n=1 Tax=Flavobacterium sp. LB3P21 TaxID=3401719 RepID=UPI003AAB9451